MECGGSTPPLTARLDAPPKVAAKKRGKRKKIPSDPYVKRPLL
jgi:hypothetical protein